MYILSDKTCWVHKNQVLYNDFQHLDKHFGLNGYQVVNDVIWDFPYYQPAERIEIIQANEGEKLLLVSSQPCEGDIELTFTSQSFMKKFASGWTTEGQHLSLHMQIFSCFCILEVQHLINFILCVFVCVHASPSSEVFS